MANVLYDYPMPYDISDEAYDGSAGSGSSSSGSTTAGDVWAWGKSGMTTSSSLASFSVDATASSFVDNGTSVGTSATSSADGLSKVAISFAAIPTQQGQTIGSSGGWTKVFDLVTAAYCGQIVMYAQVVASGDTVTQNHTWSTQSEAILGIVIFNGIQSIAGITGGTTVQKYFDPTTSPTSVTLARESNAPGLEVVVHFTLTLRASLGGADDWDATTLDSSLTSALASNGTSTGQGHTLHQRIAYRTSGNGWSNETSSFTGTPFMPQTGCGLTMTRLWLPASSNDAWQLI